jgi:hypothetical protein
LLALLNLILQVEGPFVTRDPDEVIAKLNAIEPSDGLVTCPELAISGLISALESVLPNSNAYLFFDAAAQDYDLFDKAKDLIQSKKMTVNFIISGYCKNLTAPEYTVYECLARLSGGQVFILNPDRLLDLFEATRITLDPNFVNLRSAYIDNADSYSTTVDVDSTIKKLTISVVGYKPYASLSGRDSKVVKVK